MSIKSYGAQAQKARTPWGKVSLFFRSLSLRYWLWLGARRLARQEAQQRHIKRTLQRKRR